MRAQTFEQIKKYNPYHGKDGKFTSGGSAAKTVRSRKSQVAGCKTAKQLANTVDKKYGIRMVGDIESLDFDSVKGTADGVAAAIDKFPELTGKIKSISVGNDMALGPAAYAGTEGEDISVNSSWYSNPERIKAAYEGDQKIGFHPNGDAMKLIGAHEAGHVLEKTMYEMKHAGGLMIADGWRAGEESYDVMMEAYDSYKKKIEEAGGTVPSISDLRKAVSGYAERTGGGQELFAEAISDYCVNGKNAHPFSKEIAETARKKIDGYKEKRRKARRAFEDKVVEELKENPEHLQQYLDNDIISRERAIEEGFIKKSYDHNYSVIRKYNPYHGKDGRFTTGGAEEKVVGMGHNEGVGGVNNPKVHQNGFDTDDGTHCGPGVTDPKSLAGVHKGEPMTFEQANSQKANPGFENSTYRHYNCQTCVLAYEARRRGFNVEAKPRMQGNYDQDQLSQDSTWAWRIPGTKDRPKNIHSPATFKDAEEAAGFLDNTLKEGKRYTMEFGWGDGAGAHIIIAERSKGTTWLYAPQSGKSFVGADEVKKYVSEIGGVGGQPRLSQWNGGAIRLLPVSDYDISPVVVETILSKATT